MRRDIEMDTCTCMGGSSRGRDRPARRGFGMWDASAQRARAHRRAGSVFRVRRVPKRNTCALVRVPGTSGQAMLESDWPALLVTSHFTPTRATGPIGSRAPIRRRLAQPALWAPRCRWCLPPTSEWALSLPSSTKSISTNPLVSIPFPPSLPPHRPSFHPSNARPSLLLLLPSPPSALRRRGRRCR